MQLDKELIKVIDSFFDCNRLVPWYLMTSYLYYKKDKSLVSDGIYDKLCQTLIDRWEYIEHRHKSFIDFDALKAGTGYSVTYPSMAIGAAIQKWNENNPDDKIEETYDDYD